MVINYFCNNINLRMTKIFWFLTYVVSHVMCGRRASAGNSCLDFAGKQA